MLPTASQAQRALKAPLKASNAPEGNDYSLPEEPTLRDKTAEKDNSIATLKVNVQVVNLYCTVKDKHGTLIPNLKKEDFRVSEDGKPQTIKYFAAESNQPLTLGMLIDTSGSQTNVLPMEKEVGAAFLRDVLTPKDLAFVISFDITVDLLQDYTTDTALLRRAMEKTRINDGGGGGAGGIAGAGQGTIPVLRPKGTLLYDAVYLASNEKLHTESGRKALIMLTDGGDQGSDETLAEAIAAAQKAEVIVYVIMIADRANFMPGEAEMRKLADQTGGHVIDVGNDPKKLRKAFDQIGEELRSQYLVGYVPTNVVADGKYRKIEAKTVNPDYKIQARKGYYAPKE
ncbi:MAG: VWA domain-containing protein [Acidobacteria bacterium]|nr:MAG: VWA domain-containing protein [Acidobacteriota bacterium]